MSRLTLLDKHRLRNASDYSLCYEKGRKYYSPCFILFVYKQDEQNVPWRLGMAVTKKIGSAVRRNRVRRLIRECFRLSQHYIPNGYDFVVVPKRGIDIPSLNLNKVSEEIYSFILSRIGKKNKKRSA